jgi:Tfp pilus assembly protein PilZ
MKGSDRFSADDVVATCACCGEKYSVHNLSLGGFFVSAKTQPRVGDRITLRLSLGDRQTSWIQTAVAWINADESRDPSLPVGFGVRILNIELLDKISLLSHLRRFEENRVR